jgi:hypothetical protein
MREIDLLFVLLYAQQYPQRLSASNPVSCIMLRYVIHANATLVLAAGAARGSVPIMCPMRCGEALTFCYASRGRDAIQITTIEMPGAWAGNVHTEAVARLSRS